MNLLQEYIHHSRGYRFGSRCCWIRLYASEPSSVPVVVCEEIPEIGVNIREAAEYMAAEVIAEHFPDGLSNLPRPILWIEHRPSRRRSGPGQYFLLDFPSYHPRPAAVGFVRPLTLGHPKRVELDIKEVLSLTSS
jgi:hypothetical protein